MSNLMISFFTDLEALAAKYRGLVQAGAPQASQPAQEAAATTQAPPEQAAPPAAASEEWTHEKVMATCKQIVDRNNGNTNPLIAALSVTGVKKVSETPPERLGALVAEVKRQYGEA